MADFQQYTTWGLIIEDDIMSKQVSGRIKEMVNIFEQIPDWEDRYKKIIEFGKKLDHMDPELKTEKNLISGCQSQVWLLADYNKSYNRLKFTADSDALIVKGLLFILLKIYSDSSPKEIIETKPDFISNLGLDAHLSPTRASGLFAVLKQIKLYAFIYQKQNE